VCLRGWAVVPEANRYADLRPWQFDRRHIGPEKVEIRQCLVGAEKQLGVFQLVAWQAQATAPALIVETEEKALKQFSFVPSAFVIELSGGSSSRVFGIDFRDGIPVLALKASSRQKTLIESDGATITVRITDVQNKPTSFTLGSRSERER
jgi:hypothetical protein